VLAVVNLVSASVHANTLEIPKAAKKRTGQPELLPNHAAQGQELIAGRLKRKTAK